LLIRHFRLATGRRAGEDDLGAAFGGEMRTQPCETGLPRVFTSWLPWMAWPSFMKKIEWGMGELSHCLLYQISFIDVGV
jgi:hypothetical protein